MEPFASVFEKKKTKEHVENRLVKCTKTRRVLLLSKIQAKRDKKSEDNVVGNYHLNSYVGADYRIRKYVDIPSYSQKHQIGQSHLSFV